MVLSRNPYPQQVEIGTRSCSEPTPTKKGGGAIRYSTARFRQLPAEFPQELSKIWFTLKEKLEGVLDYDYCSERDATADMFTNFTPEIILGEEHPRGVIDNVVESIKESTEKMSIEITLPRRHIGHNAPILIEVCDFISINGHRIGNISSAVRKYSEQLLDEQNPGHLIQSAPSIQKALLRHAGEKPYGILFRQYAQDYEKKVFREFRRIPYKAFTAVLFVNKNGTSL